MIQYFISYRYYSALQEGFGCLDLDLSEPIRGFEDLKNITEYIKDNLKDENGSPIKKATILNWKRFENDASLNPEQSVLEIIRKWRDFYEPTCAESLYQVDRINENLPELVESLLNIVGYYKYKDKEEE